MNFELLYVTSNNGKFAEVASYFAREIPTISLRQVVLDIQEIQSDDQHFVALDKAQKAWSILQRPLIIDDAAVYFNNYNKFPGVFSRFVSTGIGKQGLMRLFEEGDPATFLLYMVYVGADGQLQSFEGRCDGVLTKPHEFLAPESLPYDDFFIADGQSKPLLTYAQMKQDMTTYSDYFYRIRACKKVVAWLAGNK